MVVLCLGVSRSLCRRVLILSPLVFSSVFNAIPPPVQSVVLDSVSFFDLCAYACACAGRCTYTNKYVRIEVDTQTDRGTDRGRPASPAQPASPWPYPSKPPLPYLSSHYHTVLTVQVPPPPPTHIPSSTPPTPLPIHCPSSTLFLFCPGQALSVVHRPSVLPCCPLPRSFSHPQKSLNPPGSCPSPSHRASPEISFPRPLFLQPLFFPSSPPPPIA